MVVGLGCWPWLVRGKTSAEKGLEKLQLKKPRLDRIKSKKKRCIALATTMYKDVIMSHVSIEGDYLEMMTIVRNV